MFRANLNIVAGAHRIQAEMESPESGVIALLGPNGAGKTTILRALAGLAPLESGEITISGETWTSVATGIHLPPERRSVAWLPQENYLFQSMTVLENVIFALKNINISISAARSRGMEMLDRLGMASFATRGVTGLSGGEARRVALARALITNPKLLLLDEPLAPADAASRPLIRRELLKTLHAPGQVCVLVSHDPVDVLTLADSAVILDGGRVVERGPLQEIVARPRTPFAAEFVNMNIYRGTGRDGIVTIESGAQIVTTGAEGGVIVSIPTTAPSVHHERPGGSPRNAWRGSIAHLETHADRVRLHIEGEFNIRADITPAAVRAMALTAGANVWVSVKATEITVSPLSL